MEGRGRRVIATQIFRAVGPFIYVYIIVCFRGKLEIIQRGFQIFLLNLSGGFFFCFAAGDRVGKGDKGFSSVCCFVCFTWHIVISVLI